VSLGGGGVALSGALSDGFEGGVLDTNNWSAGLWAGGAYSPPITGGALSLPANSGAWVRSVTTYTRAVIEADVAFGNGPWQHVGFGSNGFVGNRYFIFSTGAGGGNLYARANNNATEQYLNLGPIPGGLHRYRIEWAAVNASTDQVRFFIDGTAAATFNVSSTGASNWYVYLSNNGSAPLQVGWAEAAGAYRSSGTYLSCLKDAGAGSMWDAITWSAGQPAGTSVSMQIRTSADGVTWSEWTGISGGPLAAPARYVQYSAQLATTDAQQTSVLESVTLNHVPSGP
jgi:hypothetical protein